MRIGIYSTQRSHRWGGSEELWYKTALKLLELGHEVGVCVRRWTPPVKEVLELKKAGCKVFYRDEKRFGFSNVRDFPWLDEFKPDFVLVSLAWFTSGGFFMKQCFEKSIPYFNIIQSAGEIDWPIDEIIEILRDNYKNAESNFFVSNANKSLIETIFATKFSNCEIVWNPFKVNYHKKASWLENLGTFKLACIARLEPASKGQDILLHILARKRWRKRSIEVSLFGGGFNEKSLKKLAENLKLENVHFCGYRNGIEEIWDEHHALILPSRLEGLPLVLVEAMLCSRIPITTKVGGIPEVVIDDEIGFLSKAPTVELFDETLERAWDRRSEWKTMGIKANAHIKKLVPEDPVPHFIKTLDKYVQLL